MKGERIKLSPGIFCFALSHLKLNNDNNDNNNNNDDDHDSTFNIAAYPLTTMF